MVVARRCSRHRLLYATMPLVTRLLFFLYPILTNVESLRRRLPAPIGLRGAAEVWRGPFSNSFLGLFLASGVVQMGLDRLQNSFGFIWAKPSILDPFRTKFHVFGSDQNFGQPGLDLTRTLDTSSEAALDVTIRNQIQN